MELSILYRNGEHLETFSRNLTSEFIREKILSLDWRKFHEVLLVRGNDFSAVGGDLSRGGLSYHCEVNGIMEISDRKPKSLDDLVNIILFHFARGISLPTNEAFTNNKREVNRSKVTTPNIEDRSRVIKNKYFEADRIEKKKRLVRFVFAALILLIIPPFAYLSFSGKLPYYINETSEVPAAVIHASAYRFFGRHKVTVKYSYEVNGYTYESYFRQTKFFYHTPLMAGDSLTVEFIENDPGHSRPISVLSTWIQSHPNEIRRITPKTKNTN